MIFLSASIPNPERDKKYLDLADVIAIRDAVRALATVVIPKTILVWGGHPAITPLIHYIMKTIDANINIREHVTLYQSNYFKKYFPPENKFIENVIIVHENKDEESSLADMRNKMIKGHDFKVGIFIGGMEGVEKEFDLFRRTHPKALILPVASTGAAARIIFNDIVPKPDLRLLNDYAYMALFKFLLKDYIN